MKHSPASVRIRGLAGQEIPHALKDLRLHYRFNNIPPLVLIQHNNTIYALISYLKSFLILFLHEISVLLERDAALRPRYKDASFTTVRITENMHYFHI
jgi:hypothetical protein